MRRAIKALAGRGARDPVHAPIVEYLREQSPDVLLVSPLVTAASEQVDWVKAARACGIRTAVCVASWDNLTNKGLLRVQPDPVLVWNEAQKREAVEYPLHARGQRGGDRRAALRPVVRTLRSRIGREASAGASGCRTRAPSSCSPARRSSSRRSDAEVAFVRRWMQALRDSAEPGLRDANILVRPHPYNCHPWDSATAVGPAGRGGVPAPGLQPDRAENRDDFFDSLYHSAVVVGINTSAMIEAAIVGRPVCSLLAPEFAGTQEGTIHFRHLLPENGGFLRIASTVEDHVAQLAECLRDPASTRAETSRFVASFIRPAGVERPATPLFADAVERLAAQPAPRPSSRRRGGSWCGRRWRWRRPRP